MATRSTIAMEFADGSVGQVYCHWDGYPEHNGKILLEHYSNRRKLHELIDLGDLSSLAPEIGTQHDFDTRVNGECTFYGRDGGEDDVAARYFDSYQDYLDKFQGEEYNYILRRDGLWYVSQGDRFVPLARKF